MTSTFSETDHPRAGHGRFTDKKQSAPELSLDYVGPSLITPGAAIGYFASESRMSREFIALEDRPEAAKKIAAGYDPETAGARVEYWMTKFDAYDMFDEEAPSGMSEWARAGYDSVTRKSLNIDLDHQPLSYNAFTLSNNEELAANRGGLYRHSDDPERQKQLDEFWDARAERCKSLKERLLEMSLR